MKKVLGLTVIALCIASPAWAGDTFVRNETIHRTNRTETSLEVDTVTKSNRTEHYNSYSEKIFFDGNVANRTQSQSSIAPEGFQQQFVSDNSVLKLSNVFLNDDNYAEAYNTNNSNGLTIHRSGSSLTGTFIEDITTRVTGTVYSVTNETFRSHETTAGVR
ncbi:hypothetical protein IQ255_28750 [Pleurocapsales cyanobacterium LEGE 10410]|nr:hypothetical protein [Pleurocapsales cyanobacterium LEGE 10410]